MVEMCIDGKRNPPPHEHIHTSCRIGKYINVRMYKYMDEWIRMIYKKMAAASDTRNIKFGHIVRYINRHLGRYITRHLDRYITRHLDRYITRHLDRYIIRHLDR